MLKVEIKDEQLVVASDALAANLGLLEIGIPVERVVDKVHQALRHDYVETVLMGVNEITDTKVDLHINVKNYQLALKWTDNYVDYTMSTYARELFHDLVDRDTVWAEPVDDDEYLLFYTDYNKNFTQLYLEKVRPPAVDSYLDPEIIIFRLGASPYSRKRITAAKVQGRVPVFYHGRPDANNHQQIHATVDSEQFQSVVEGSRQ